VGVTGELEGPPAITGNLSVEQKQELAARCGASPGDVILFAAGLPRAVNRTLDAMRTYLAENLGFIDKQAAHEILWITDFPMFEWNEDEQRLEVSNASLTMQAYIGDTV
jgi:aspartyl-tRNA synthetase